MRRLLLAFLVIVSAATSYAQIGNVVGSRGGQLFTTTFLYVDGNGINLNFDTTGLPNIPASWRGNALAVVIGAAPVNGAALRGYTNLDNHTGYTTRYDFYLASEATSAETFCTIAVGKGISALDFEDPSTPIAYYIKLSKTSGLRKIQIDIPTDSGAQTFTWSGTVALQTIVHLENDYNIRTGHHTFEVNGDTVLDRDFDGTAVQSIGTLVVGSSGGATCRNVVYLVGRILESPVPPVPFTASVSPSAPVISGDSIANGATSVPLTGQSLGCSSTNALTYQILLGTSNPPTAPVTLINAAACSYALTGLLNNTTYYWRVKPTNATATVTGDVWSFTTVAVPTNGDLDLIAAKAACADSADDSPTGRNPNLLWTCTRQEIWNQMVDDFEAAGCVVAAACSATPSTLGGRIFKKINDHARTTTATGDGTQNWGQWNVIAYQMTGNLTYVTNTTWGALKKINDRYLVSTPFPSTDVNVSRVIQGMHTLMVEWLWPALTDQQRLDYVAEIDAHNDAGWLVYAGGQGRWTDADQTIGQLYFPFAMMKVILPNNVSNNAIWDDVNVGGFDAEDCTLPVLSGVSNNQRDGLCVLFTVLSADGEYNEGPMYAKETIPYAALFAEAVSSARGVDTYPEITAFMEDYVDQQAASYTPDLLKQLQYTDEQNPNILQTFYVGSTLMTAAGIFQGTDRGRRANALLADMITTHGESALFWPSGANGGAGGKWWGAVLYNPYDTTVDWKTSKSYYASGQGVQYLKSGFTASDSLFVTQCNPQPIYTDGQYATGGYDHQPWYACTPSLYKNGEWIVDQIGSYAGASAMAEGHNAMRYQGLGRAKEFGDVRERSLADTHSFIAGVTGGSIFPRDSGYSGAFNGPPPVFLNEGSRAVLEVPGAIATIIVHDRASVDDIAADNTDLNRYVLGCGEFGRSHITTQHAKQEWQWHIPVDPTVVGGVYTWTTPVTSQSVKLTSLLPAAATRTVYDLATTFATNQAPTSTRCGWSNQAVLSGAPFYYTVDGGGYNRKLLKIWPSSMGTFHTYLHVLQVGASTPATPTLITNNDAECAHVVTTGQNDILACFNGATSTVLSNTHYDVAHRAILQSARLRAAGAFTVAYTASATTTELHLADLNPSLGWTYNVDGSGAVTINAAGLTSTGGYARISLSLAAGAHSIVVTGS